MLLNFGFLLRKYLPQVCLIEPDQSQLVAPLEREEKDAAEALLVEQVGIPPMLYSGQVSQTSPLKEMEFLSGKT